MSELLIHNVETGEIIFAQVTDEEMKLREAGHKQAEIWRAEMQAKEAARAAILEKLGLTEEEAAVLLG